MYIPSHGEVGVESDINNIDYKPTNTDDADAANLLVYQELTARGIDDAVLLDQSKMERVELLRTALQKEEECQELQGRIKRIDAIEKALYDPDDASACILHTENRSNLTNAQNVLMDGLNEATSGKLSWIPPDKHKTAKSRAEVYIKVITEIVETEVLGKDQMRADWRFPVSKTDNTQMEALKMPNPQSRRFMQSIGPLLEKVYSERHEKRDLLIEYFDKYNDGIKILRARVREYKEGEIDRFQVLMDEWFQGTLAIFGKKAITNYTHDLSARHIARYMRELGPLWRFSNEGWEALNGHLKASLRMSFKHSSLLVLDISNL
jgi:hypothetical protein